MDKRVATHVHKKRGLSPAWTKRNRVIAIPFALWLLASCQGEHQGPGEIQGGPVPQAVIALRQHQQAQALQNLAPAEQPTKTILWGDLHVHTTFSADAFLRSLPMLQGEGLHPPADACDFARYCSSLDFWSINDHAEALTPPHWQETKESIRQCNALAGDPKNPDVVAFLGWEWSQVGQTADTHYGHRNVIFRDLDDDRVPKRPISALDDQLIGGLRQPLPLRQRVLFPLLDWSNRHRYYDFGRFVRENIRTPLCPRGIDTRQLPADCHEAAPTPAELFEKLAQWGFEVLVIPHGTTWGFYTPPDSTFDKQLKGPQHDPQRQILFEIYSGHGNSEEYRPWKAVDFDAQGNPVCPPPTKDYLPCCWQAGEIIRKRCKDASPQECERRVAEARQNYLRAGVAGHLTVPGAEVEDWLDCGQCRNCFNPAFNYRPGNSAQYILALTNFDEGKRRFRFGFIASSDNHSARPGTGYKEYARRAMTEAAGARDAAWRNRILRPQRPAPESRPFDARRSRLQPFQLLEFERQASFFMTGGLVAVHAEGRDRDSIWRAMKRREVYGTSGDRILLWFDLLNAPGGAAPMGSEVESNDPPRFRVRAVGAFKQKPGCPEESLNALPPERLRKLCRGECYNPSDERYRITEIHVVRIRPQESPEEPIGELIEDPWRRFECANSTAGCEVEFDDPDYAVARREFVYYVRALQEPTLAVNAGGLRCKYDASGNCVEVDPCYGDFRTPYDEDCLWPNQERAWSSPIYLRPVTETVALP